MPVIMVFSASSCHGDEVASNVAEMLGYRLLTTETLVAEAAKRFPLSAEKLDRAMHGPPSFFQRFGRDKEKGVAYLRATLAELIAGDDLVHHGFATHLIPAELTHVLRVCLVARSEYRQTEAERAGGISTREAQELVKREDAARTEWTTLLHRKGPWDKSQYDVFLPMDATTVAAAAAEICEHARRPALATTPAALEAVEGFRLASQVGIMLTEKGHDVLVAASGGEVTITIDHYVLRLQHLEDELRKLAGAVAGVTAIHTRVGPHFKRPDIYPKMDIPQKILLVDDEKEFVHTLSERLETRELGAAIAYDGEQAMEMIRQDAPDVMVLDLKMPGLDGLEVLRQVKQDHPETEVIILTGHGSTAEESLAMALGAFAYLQKPADIDLLARTMREANAKVRAARERGS